MQVTKQGADDKSISGQFRMKADRETCPFGIRYRAGFFFEFEIIPIFS